VKKFNMNRFTKISCALLAVVVAIICWPEPGEDVITRKFCAYGETYVEFEHGGKIWGTTFLNENGKPLSCTEDEIKAEPVNSWKSTI